MNETLELDLEQKNKFMKNNDINKENFHINNINIKNDNFINNSFGDLTLSDIGKIEKNCVSISSRSNNQKNENFEKKNYMYNEIEKRSSGESIKLEDFNNFLIKNKKVKLNKEDLNNIPLPIFSCIYCCNEKISFNHLLNEILSEKYLLLTSIYDIQELNKILSYKYIYDKDDKNSKFEKIILFNTEYINKYYNYDLSKEIIYKKGDEKICYELYQKKLIEYINKKLNLIKLKKIQKNIGKPSSMIKNFNQYYSYNHNCIYYNNLINNSHDGTCEFNYNNNTKKNIQFNINHTCSNISESNFNSVSLINYIDNNFMREKDKKFKLNDIIEQIEKNSNIEYEKNNLSRKIKKEDIEWENKYYNIWSPFIEPIFTQNIQKVNKKILDKKINQTFIKMKKNDFSLYNKIREKNTTIKKKKVFPKSGENSINYNYNKSNQKNNLFKNKTKELSTDNIKGIKYHSITDLINHSNINNNKKYNILIKLNKSPTKIYNINYKNKNFTFNNKKTISQKSLLKTHTITTDISNKKNLNINPINLFNSPNAILKYKTIKHQIPLDKYLKNKSINYNNKIKNKNCNKTNKKESSYKNIIHQSKLNSLNLSNSNKNPFKKIEVLTPINGVHNKINYIQKSQLNSSNKFVRNNTYKKFKNKKEVSIIINIKDDYSDELHPKKTYRQIKINNNINNNNNKNKNKKTKSSLSNNQKKKYKNNNIHFKTINDIIKPNFINENNNVIKKNSYNIKIFKKEIN